MDKQYSNGEIIVKWQPKKCRHAGICVASLPKVYNPKNKPWISINNATTTELKKQISQCPSGALTYTSHE